MNNKFKVIIFIFILTLAQDLYGAGVCHTNFGKCLIRANSPIGSLCYCGYDEGDVIGNDQRPISNICVTNKTSCKVNFTLIDEGCGCMLVTGPSYGQIISIEDFEV